MGRDSKTFVTIDAGSSRIRVVAAQRNPSEGIKVLSVGQAQALGIQRGIVDNIDDASLSIRAALEDAGLADSNRGLSVYATLSGKHIGSMNHGGEVYTTKNDGIVSAKDVERSIDASKVIAMPADTEVVHVIPRAFRVDGYICRRNPVGMHGGTVTTESHIITASAAAVKNLRKAVQMAGKDLDGFIAGGVASGQAVLTAEEKEMGVVMVDIGGGTTDTTAYAGGAPFHTSSLPVGGYQIANDIAIALNTSFHVAERLYHEEGSGKSEGVDPAEELTVPCFGLTGTRTLRRVFLNEVIALRLTEILRMAFFRAKQTAPDLSPIAGVVITGGVARLRHIDVLAQTALEVPVRVGSPIQVDGLSQELADPSFATAVGSLLLSSDPASDIIRNQRNGNHNPLRLWPQLLGTRA